MFDLLSLPNEILYRIIECVDPKDLDDLSKSCPLLERLSEKTLAEHHEREREYTKVFLQGCHRHGDDSHPLDLLSSIFRDAKVALYPISLTVECCGCREEEHTDENLAEAEDLWGLPTDRDAVDKWKIDASTVANIMADYANDTQKLVMNSGYFNKKGREHWFDLVRRSNRGAILALLLTLLPNLETLQCNQYTWKARNFKEIVRHMTNPRGRKASKMHKKGAKILTKLREVKIDGHACDGYFEFFEDFDLAAYFAKLPSVRTIYASPAKNFLDDRNPWIEVGSRTSNIEEITVRTGEMDATYMSRCLGSLKALRKFEYSNPWDITYVLHRSGVIVILEALLEHANTSLELLSLHSSPWSSLEGGAAIPLTLKPFDKLKEATLSCHLWAPVFLEDNEEPQNIRSDDSAVQKPNLFRPSKLVDILPGCMEKVNFYGKAAMEHVETMLQGLVEHKANRLPRLEEITFDEVAHTETPTVAKMAREMQEQCSGIGITLGIRIIAN